MMGNLEIFDLNHRCDPLFSIHLHFFSILYSLAISHYLLDKFPLCPIYTNKNQFLVGFRVVEDYAVVFLGSALFQIIRLFIVAIFTIHFFTCLFYHTKVSAALKLL